MREVLFRGKDVRGAWYYGLLAHIKGGWYISNKAGIATAYEVREETVGQYTGLTDKNGKKIFEGDILPTDLERTYLIVEFRDGCFMFNCNDGGKDYYDIMLPILPEEQTVYKYGEVIGNIHDNPELLGGADNGE